MKCPLTERGCGGRIELSVPYGEHLRRKQAAVRKLFPDALPIVGMENPCHYRGKVLSTFANGRSGLYSGIYAAGSHRVLSVRDCILHDRRADEIVGISREILAASGLTAYNEDAGTGTLRHMQLRRAAGTGEVLLTLVTPSAELPDAKALAAQIVRKCPDVRSVVQNINPRKTSAVLGFKEIVLYRPGYIDDVLMGMKFRISSRSFYQVNSRQTEKLYGKALALVKTSLYSFLLETRADGKTVLLDMLTEFDAMRTERIGRTTWLVGRMGGPLDGGRGEYGCWYNLETRGADILYAEFTVESYMGGSICTGTWASEDCLIYALTEETQTEGESVAVTSQIKIEGIRGLYTAKDIQRESVFEKTLRREYVYDASRGRLVIAGAQ